LTNNSKAGPSFSLSREHSCVFKTPACAQACYGNGIRYQTPAARSKRERNFRTCEFLLDAGGEQALAENLVALVDQARPSDFIAARINGCETRVPWTLRIHDVGDFYSVPYVRAWISAVQQKPSCRFWFYTRSFADPSMLDALTELAALPNCKGWLSLDSDNFEQGLLTYAHAKPGIWSISILQEKVSLMPPDMVSSITAAADRVNIINFPRHHGGRHVPVATDEVRTCPQILGAYPLQNNPDRARPCQSCAICLP
jgi:hypothetical protein